MAKLAWALARRRRRRHRCCTADARMRSGRTTPAIPRTWCDGRGLAPSC